jgi:uncharacterized OsmC-like protein
MRLMMSRMSATIMLRVTAPDRDAARVSVRRHQFVVGRPLEFDAASPRIAAMEYALGALGGEIVNGVRRAAARRRIGLDAIEATITGELENELTYLEVVDEEAEPRIASIFVKVFVSSADEAAVRDIFARAVGRLPLLATLRSAVRLTTELVLVS